MNDSQDQENPDDLSSQGGEMVPAENKGGNGHTPIVKPKGRKSYPQLNKEQQLAADMEAYNLRVTGRTYPVIAKAQNVGLSTAHRRVMRYLEYARKQLALDPIDYIDIECGKLDKLEPPLWNRAMGYDDQGNKLPGGPDLECLDKILSIMDRRAKYRGLYKPIKFTPTTPEGDEPFKLVLENLTLEQKLALLELRRHLVVDEPKALEQAGD